MIITRVPLRISLAGGGSDMPAFYERECGVVVSFAIDKFIYVTVNDKFDGRTRVSYSRTENVNRPIDLQHDLARECLNYYHMSGLEITTVSDIPGEGTGLGSSSAFTVGLCQALSHKRRETMIQSDLAERAFLIERTLCQHPVGKQDHYASAFGGLNRFNFRPDFVNYFPLSIHAAAYLQENLMFFWTGVTRSSKEILREQEKNIGMDESGFRVAAILRDLAIYLADYFRTGEYDMLGQILREGWEAKKSLARGISAEWIENLYERALEAGATGGKLCGAGGGGFLLFAVPKDRRAQVEKALGLRRVPFKIETVGARIIYSD